MPDSEWVKIQDSDAGLYINKEGLIKNKHDRILKYYTNSYSVSHNPSFTIVQNGQRTQRKVAELVLEAFGTSRPSFEYKIAHKDNNIKNIHFDNLYWEKIESPIEINNERWKWIAGLENKYKISDHGRILSYLSQDGAYPRNPHLLKPSFNRNHYRVCLIIDDERQPKTISRLVGQAFLDKRYEKPYVKRKDGCKENDHYTNLTYSYSPKTVVHKKG